MKNRKPGSKYCGTVCPLPCVILIWKCVDAASNDQSLGLETGILTRRIFEKKLEINLSHIFYIIYCTFVVLNCNIIEIKGISADNF